MGISQEPDQNPRRTGHHSWSYLEIPNGTSAVGYSAGPICGVFTHYVSGTRPCKRRLTNSVLICPYCESKEEPVWRGYLPLYDRDYKRRFVLIGADIRLAVMELETHTPIRIARGKSKREGVTVRADAWTVKSCPMGEGRREEADIEPFLFTLWKDRELIEWYLKRPSTPLGIKPAVAVTPEAPAVPNRPVPKSIKQRMKLAPPAVETKDSAPIGDDLDTLMARMRGKAEIMAGAQEVAKAFTVADKPSTNGKHKPVPPKG